MFNNAKAIETKYKGYRFRSRLEARWAIYFDAIGWKWDYEPEGFELDGERYLPDFLILKKYEWMTEFECMWLEIKPKKPNELEITKAKLLASHTKITVALGIGLPDPGKLSYGLDAFVGDKGEFIENYVSLDFYCFQKWGRPGWFMFNEHPCDETILACIKAKETRFEFDYRK